MLTTKGKSRITNSSDQKRHYKFSRNFRHRYKTQKGKEVRVAPQAAPAHPQLGQGIKQERGEGEGRVIQSWSAGQRRWGEPYTRCCGRLRANELSLNLKTDAPILTASYQEKKKGLRHNSTQSFIHCICRKFVKCLFNDNFYTHNLNGVSTPV